MKPLWEGSLHITLFSAVCTYLHFTALPSHKTANCTLPFTFQNGKQFEKVTPYHLSVLLFEKPLISQRHIISSFMFKSKLFHLIAIIGIEHFNLINAESLSTHHCIKTVKWYTTSFERMSHTHSDWCRLYTYKVRC